MNHEQLPAIEPLSDLSWRRLEYRLFDELDRDQRAAEAIAANPAHRWSWGRCAALCAGAIACAAIALLVVSRSDDHPAAVSARPDSSRITTLDAATTVTEGPLSITVQPRSAVLVTRSPEPDEVVLEHGAVALALAPSADRTRPLRVRAGEVTVVVTGTRFTVARSAAATSVVVVRGSVDVVYQGSRRPVRAGETWSPHSDAELAMDADIIERPRRQMRSTATRRTPRSASAETQATAPTDAERFARAAGLEARDAAGALVIYRKLARGDGAWAAPSLFAKGRLEAELGRTAKARATLERYLRRHARGANALDARALLGQLR